MTWTSTIPCPRWQRAFDLARLHDAWSVLDAALQDTKLARHIATRADAAVLLAFDETWGGEMRESLPLV